MDKRLNNIKKPGFKTPKDYFDGLEDVILSQAKLSNMESSGFKMPEGYLDTLEDKVMAKVSNTNDTKVIRLFNRKNLLYVASIAATILLLFNLSIFETKRIDSVDKLDTATLESYILNEDIDSYEIGSLINNQEISEENFIDHNFSDENMEEYILNNIDIEDFFSE